MPKGQGERAQTSEKKIKEQHTANKRIKTKGGQVEDRKFRFGSVREEARRRAQICTSLKGGNGSTKGEL